jgi:hypothetical protein
MRSSWISGLLAVVLTARLALCVPPGDQSAAQPAPPAVRNIPAPNYGGNYLKADPNNPFVLYGLYSVDRKLTDDDLAWLAWKAAEEKLARFAQKKALGSASQDTDIARTVYEPNAVTVWQVSTNDPAKPFDVWIASSGGGEIDGNPPNAHGEDNVLRISNRQKTKVTGGRVLTFVTSKSRKDPTDMYRGLRDACTTCKDKIRSAGTTDAYHENMFPNNKGWVVKWYLGRKAFFYRSQYDSGTTSPTQPTTTEMAPKLPEGWTMEANPKSGTFFYKDPKGQSRSAKPAPPADPATPPGNPATPPPPDAPPAPGGGTKRPPPTPDKGPLPQRPKPNAPPPGAPPGPVPGADPAGRPEPGPVGEPPVPKPAVPKPPERRQPRRSRSVRYSYSE